MLKALTDTIQRSVLRGQFQTALSNLKQSVESPMDELTTKINHLNATCDTALHSKLFSKEEAALFTKTKCFASEVLEIRNGKTPGSNSDLRQVFRIG